jgi:hypothetical protein
MEEAALRKGKGAGGLMTGNGKKGGVLRTKNGKRRRRND